MLPFIQTKGEIMALKILLAMDSSEASSIALEEMADRPWPEDALFDVLGVVEPSHLWKTSQHVQESAREARAAVDGAVARLAAKKRAAKGEVLFGDPKRLIAERAKSAGANLLVAGSLGPLGSTAVAVLRRAPCSVEIVRRRASARPQRKILLATDGSESSERAARSIADRPWPVGTEVRVLSAVELIVPTGYALFEPPYIDTEVLETARAEAMKRAQIAIVRAREMLSAAGLNSSESVSVLLDPPKTVIVNEAAEWGADIIVLGSHGHHGIDRLLLGSVSEAVATHAACSVEVIR